jgi:RimJ/RimL family protein N-acetyltransferase
VGYAARVMARRVRAHDDRAQGLRAGVLSWKRRCTMANVFYEGERIYFRPLELEDEPLLRRWINDPNVWSTLLRRTPQNAIREREWIEKLYKDPAEVAVGIVVKDGDVLIGAAGLHAIDPVHRHAVFGILIGEIEQQNRGYGTEATRLIARYGFEVLNLHRISLEVFADNPRAIKVYERSGYALEGRERQRWFLHGHYVDGLRYGILRKDWELAQEQEREMSLAALPSRRPGL